jgi:hypothetical protein
MKAIQVSSFEKPSILDHNGNTIYIVLSTLDVPAISVAHAPPDLRQRLMYAQLHRAAKRTDCMAQ